MMSLCVLHLFFPVHILTLACSLNRYLAYGSGDEGASNGAPASVQAAEPLGNKRPSSSATYGPAEPKDVNETDGHVSFVDAHTGEPLLPASAMADNHLSGSDPMMFPGILAREHRNNSSRNLAQGDDRAK